MTVQELIDALKKFPPDFNVMYLDNELGEEDIVHIDLAIDMDRNYFTPEVLPNSTVILYKYK